MLQYYVKEHKASIFENNKLPNLLYMANTEEMKTYLPRMLHKHNDHLEIVFIVKGEGTHLIGGKKYHTKAGDILIFNPGVIHDEAAQIDSNMEVYCCGINRLHIKGMDKNCLFEPEDPAVIFSGKRQEIIRHILDIMFFHIKGKYGNTDELCCYLLSSLLTILVELPRDVNPFQLNKYSLMGKVRLFLEQNFSQELALQDIADRFKISPYYLSRRFKEETDFSPIQYLNRLRLGEAQSLLITSHLSVTQIANEVGYENISYFSTLFTKTVGLSPSAYRTFWVGKSVI